MFKIILLLFSFSAFSYFDLSAGAASRSYPNIGGQAFLEAGYNQVIWGEGNKKNPLYGLIRPYLKLASSGVINSYETSIEIFPISFLGVVFGKESVTSKFDKFDFFDCDQIHCEGTIKRDFVSYKLALGYGPIVTTGQITFYENEYSTDNTKQFGEFKYITLANSPKDDLYTSRYVLGYKLGDDLLAAVTEYSKLKISKQSSKMDILAYIKKNEKSVLTFGAGAMKTTHEDSGFIAVFQYQYKFIDGLKLF